MTWPPLTPYCAQNTMRSFSQANSGVKMFTCCINLYRALDKRMSPVGEIMYSWTRGSCFRKIYRNDKKKVFTYSLTHSLNHSFFTFQSQLPSKHGMYDKSVHHIILMDIHLSGVSFYHIILSIYLRVS